MADLPPPSESSDTGVSRDDGSSDRTPRWVKVFAAIALVVVLLLILLLFIWGPGGHGPRWHMSHDDAAGHSTTAITAEPQSGGAAGSRVHRQRGDQ
jgi:hypothetical protein